MARRFTHIIGIDEVGRGPIAGPVTVCAVAIRLEELCNQPMARAGYLKLLSGVKIRDSKKLSPQKRGELLSHIHRWKEGGHLSYAISFVGSARIDEIGIAPSICQAVAECLEELGLDPETTLVLLDGALRAPKLYPYQHTIIKGDEKEQVIALASIVAKVMRDDVMEQYGLLYPEYLFENHKGYGTHEHYRQIKKYGLSPLHRRSFMKKLLAGQV